MAALEAEKWLAENEDVPVANGVEADEGAKKGNSGEAPEYRSNPLL